MACEQREWKGVWEAYGTVDAGRHVHRLVIEAQLHALEQMDRVDVLRRQ